MAVPCTKVLYLAERRAGITTPSPAQRVRQAVIPSSRAAMMVTGSHQ